MIYATCEVCRSDFELRRSDARYCTPACRSWARRIRDEALVADLAAFRSGVASIIARMAEADGDPEALAALGAEVAAFTPDSFARRRS